MRIACTGFVSSEAGSVASANALLLRELVARGVSVDFFSKPSFVDPRPAVGERAGFRFIAVVNTVSDALRRGMAGLRTLSALAAWNDAATYNRLLVRSMSDEHRKLPYDAVLWLGDYAHGSVPGAATVSFAQGAPGTDARSILRRKGEIQRLAGRRTAWKWELLGRLRLSRFGLPGIRYSDRIVVGSSISRERLLAIYGISRARIFTIPYPIDLEFFRLPEQSGQVSEFNAKKETKSRRGARISSSTLRILWLGRIVPRKRLDIFLEGSVLALQGGLDVRLTIVGNVGFIKGYEKLIDQFPIRDRLQWLKGVPRCDVPALLATHDVLAQPSEEENFGSSVAEAQACGLPVIVGATNGNIDYLCSRDIRLADGRPATFAAALREMAARKLEGRWGSPHESRKLAEREFCLPTVAGRLLGVIQPHSTQHSCALV